MATPIFTNKLMVDATSLTTAVLSNYKVTPVTTPSHHGVITTEVSGITQTTSGTDVSLYLFIAPDPLPTAIATVAHLVDAGCAVEYGVRLNPGDHLALTQDILRVNEAMYVMPVGGTVSVACKGVGLPEDGTSDLSSNIDLIGYSGVSVTPTVTLSVPVLAITGVYATNGIDITVTLTATPNPAVVPTGDTLSTITYSLKDSTAGSAELVTTNSGMSYSKNVTLTAPAASVASWTASVTYTTAASISESSTAVTLQRTSVKYPIIAPTLTATAKYTDASKTKVNLTLSSTAAAGMVTGDSLSVVNWTCTPKTAPSTPIVLNDTTAALSNTMSSIAVDAAGWDIVVKYTTVKGGVVTSATVSILNANITAAAAQVAYIVNTPTFTATAKYTDTSNTKVDITLTGAAAGGMDGTDSLSVIDWTYAPVTTPSNITSIYDTTAALSKVIFNVPADITGWDITVRYTTTKGATALSTTVRLSAGSITAAPLPTFTGTAQYVSGSYSHANLVLTGVAAAGDTLSITDWVYNTISLVSPPITVTQPTGRLTVTLPNEPDNNSGWNITANYTTKGGDGSSSFSILKKDILDADTPAPATHIGATTLDIGYGTAITMPTAASTVDNLIVKDYHGNIIGGVTLSSSINASGVYTWTFTVPSGGTTYGFDANSAGITYSWTE